MDNKNDFMNQNNSCHQNRTCNQDNLYQLQKTSGLQRILHLINIKWFALWKGNPPGFPLLFLSLGISLIMIIPVIYVVWQSISAGTDSWVRLLDDRIPGLLWNTLSLTAAVTFTSVLLGVSLAWIVIRTDIPGRKIWRWLLALPLVIPPYVGAVTFIIVFGPSGWLQEFWTDSWILTNLLGDYSFDLYSFAGVFLVMTLFTYPYVFLIVSASLSKMNRNFEEVARSQGLGSWEIFRKVNLPMLRPAIGAGAILVSLYVLSDFGAISMLRYVTFTAAIYFQRAGFDTASASVLSLVLILLTVVIMGLESKTKRKSKFYQTTNSHRKPVILRLGKWKPVAVLYVVTIFAFSVLIPVGVLIYWSNIGLRMGALDADFFEYAINSLLVSGSAAIISMIFTMPIIYIKSRYPSPLASIINRFSYAGYALPGVIVALGFVFIFNNHLPWIYGTFYMIALALVVRFLPQALQAGESSLSLISPKIDEAARSLGYPPWKVMFKVILPNILPGILSGGALVFVSSLKELPASLMLRPPGFDTLAVRIYADAHDGIYHMAAPGALLIILVSIIPLRYMLNKH